MRLHSASKPIKLATNKTPEIKQPTSRPNINWRKLTGTKYKKNYSPLKKNLKLEKDCNITKYILREEKKNSPTALTSVQFIHIHTMTDGVKYM